MRLLSRYLLRQLAAPFVFALAALTSLMLLSQIAKKFGALVGKGLPWSVIGEVFALSLPFIVAMTLPMAVLLAVLYAFSHLAADNEITAMRASGISVYQILAPVLAWGVVMSVLNFAFVDQVLPRTNARLRGLLIDIGRKKPTLELREQVINEVPPSQYFLRAGRIDAATGRLRDITIYDMGGETNRRIIYADSGQMAYNEGRTDLNLRLYDGSIHQYRPSDPLTFQLTYYRVNDIRVKDVYDELVRNSSETVRGDREMSTCEMLTVMQDARRDLRKAERERQSFLISDLRTLLHLPPLAPAAGDTVPDRLPAYCGWIDRVQTALTKTAEPRPAAQSPPPAAAARVARQGARVPVSAAPALVPDSAPAHRASGIGGARPPGAMRQPADTPVVPPKSPAAGGRVPAGDRLDAVRRQAARTGAADSAGTAGAPTRAPAGAPGGAARMGGDAPEAVPPAVGSTRVVPGAATGGAAKPVPRKLPVGSALPGQEPAGGTRVPPPRAVPVPARPGQLKPAVPRPGAPAGRVPTPSGARPGQGAPVPGGPRPSGLIRSPLSNWAQVATAQDRQEEAGGRLDRYSVEVHKKWSISFACISFVIIGIVMALRFPRGGIGLVIGGGLLIFSVHYIGLTAGESLADRGLVSPWEAMWAPNILLTVVGVFGLIRVSRESGSTRGGDFQEILDGIRHLFRRLRRRPAPGSEPA